uniref:Uncharacterized protein n=1 Tax=Marseillevirus LCMAC201 TaxID=2506605 RepID=A0A481YX31_9VIRU|nr:MAG: hypothetical protein LCMAC201_03470 [Marseillevirus LCMAC201]
MTGQSRKDPFHVNRDKVNDNLAITRKLRLVRGAQIRARQQFATAQNASAAASVPMPYTGSLNLLSGGTNTIFINNPFVVSTTPVVLNSGPNTPTITVGSGVITITGPISSATPYLLAVGTATDAVNNGFAQ